MIVLRKTVGHLTGPRDWPATAGWAEIMAVAYATHVIIVGIGNGAYGFGAGAFGAADTIDLIAAFAAAIAVSLAVRLGSKAAYIFGTAMLIYPLIGFIQDLPRVADTGAVAFISTFLPALFALIAIGCLNSRSCRSWMILRRGSLASQRAEIPNTVVATFGAVADYSHSLQVYADQERISLIDVHINATGHSEFAKIIFIPRKQQLLLIQGFRAAMGNDDLPSDDFHAALVETLQMAFKDKGLGLEHIPELAIKHKFSFQVARKNLGHSPRPQDKDSIARYH